MEMILVPGAVPEPFRPLLERVTLDLPQLLASNFVGLYVYGSLLDSSFVSSRSDLDCIAVTERTLDDQKLQRLRGWFTGLAEKYPICARMQMSLLVKDRILENDPTASLYQFGVLQRCGSDGNPIIWLDFFRRGLTLVGPDPGCFVPTISSQILHEALIREVGYLREEISLKLDSDWRDRSCYRAYAVLTLCRILYSGETGRVTSKPDAAEWAVGNTPVRFHRLIRQAKEVSDEVSTAELPVRHIETFIRHVERQIAHPAGTQNSRN